MIPTITFSIREIILWLMDNSIQSTTKELDHPNTGKRKEVFQMKMDELFTMIINEFLDNIDYDRRIYYLQLGINSMNNKTRSNFPNHLITNEFIKELYFISFREHDTELNTTGLNFIYQVFAKNDEFDTNLIKNHPDNLIEMIKTHIQKSVGEELKMEFGILANLILKDEETAVFINENFPSDFILELYAENLNTMDEFSLWCYGMCYLLNTIDDFRPYYIFSFEHFSENCSPYVAFNLLHAILAVTQKHINVLEISPEPQEISKILAEAYSIKKNKIKYIAMKLLYIFWKLSMRTELFQVFPLKSIVNRLEYPIPEGEFNVKITNISLHFLSDLIASNYRIKFKSDKINQLKPLTRDGNIKTRIAACTLAVTLAEFGDDQTKFILLMTNFADEVLIFFESEKSDEQLIALRFAASMCIYAKKVGKSDIILNSIEEYREYIEDISNETKDNIVLGFAKVLISEIDNCDNIMDEIEGAEP